MHMLHLCTSDALLYVCGRLPFVSIRCQRELVFHLKTNASRHFIEIKSKFATNIK